ncbi:MAG: DUF5676 family membrane protein [Hydrococcus sp. Prado102]|nr:DUF5676 family membrane protein [Hydrococcus sp. Prado102]
MTVRTHHHHNEHQHENRSRVMKLNARSLSLATAVMTGLVYTICVLFIAVTPKAAMAFFSYILHADLTQIARLVTFGSFIAGLLFWTVGTALYAALIAGFYNRLTPR